MTPSSHSPRRQLTSSNTHVHHKDGEAPTDSRTKIHEQYGTKNLNNNISTTLLTQEDESRCKGCDGRLIVTNATLETPYYWLLDKMDEGLIDVKYKN